jgi:hypothetical protein
MDAGTFKAIRYELGLSEIGYGLALGYTGNDNTIKVTIKRYESDRQDIPPRTARLAVALVMLERHGCNIDRFERQVTLMGAAGPLVK